MQETVSSQIGIINTYLLDLLTRYREQPEQHEQIENDIFQYCILENPYIPHKPTPKQTAFLKLLIKEAFYGGACGGGKSDALLMAALMFVSIPNYSAIIFRQSFKALALPGALMDRAKEWLGPTDAHWNSLESAWSFPSGAKLSFGYLECDADKYRYQSAEFQFVGFDETTQFLEDQYRYLFSRLRRLATCDIPLRMRSASNPGNVGHDWVKRRFIVEGETFNRVFISAKLNDNPHLDHDAYIDSLNELDPITKRQYLEGDWNARHGGSIFPREKFQVITAVPNDLKYVRYWDKAATVPKANTDPDFTVGVKMAEQNGFYYVVDIVRMQKTPYDVETTIRNTAAMDGLATKIYMEQEPGSSGVEAIDHYNREVLKGFSFYGVKTTGSKSERASPFSSAVEAGNVFLLTANWNTSYLDELEAFPLGAHDDQVDASSGAFQQLTHKVTAWAKFIEL